MKVLLDENIPRSLYRRLREGGWDVEHPVVTGRRGLPDKHFVERLQREVGLIVLTQDEDFAALVTAGAAGQLLLSRVRQNRPVTERVDIWCRALNDLLAAPRSERLLELDDQGTIHPWKVVEL